MTTSSTTGTPTVPDGATLALPTGSPATARRGRGVAKRLAMIVVSMYLAWCAVLLLIQETLIFPRSMAGIPAEGLPRGAEQVWITTAEGSRVEGYFFAARGPGERPGPAVIYAHGNAELIQDCTEIARMYNAWGISVLIPEYRGYGNSGGAPSQAGIGADFVQFYDWLAARPEVDAERVIVHGRSLGGGVAAQLAAQRRPAALVLESTFTSIASFTWGFGVPPVLARHPFRTDRVLAELVDVPTLIMHGRSDTIVPVSHGRRLRGLSPGAVYYETDDNHYSFPTDLRAYEGAVRGLLEGRGLLAEPGLVPSP